MRRFMAHLWAGTGWLAALLMCSCQHSNCCRNCCCPNRPAPAPATAAPLVPSSGPASQDNPVQSEPTDLPAVSTSAPGVASAKIAPADAGGSQNLPDLLGQSSPDTPPPTSERFGHGPNYCWLVGTLDYSRIQDAWLLRYVPFDEDDRYGGCVTLVGTVPSMPLEAGKTVRVEGSVIDPDSRQLRPAFQVRSIRAAGS